MEIAATATGRIMAARAGAGKGWLDFCGRLGILVLLG
jgi:hypothetical protein